MTLIARNLRSEADGTTILHDLDVEAKDGDLVGVIGPRDSGKSALLLALNGFRPADGGTVTVDGRDLYDNFEEIRRDIGYLPDGEIVPTALTVERALEYATELRLPNRSADERRERVAEWIERLALGDDRHHKISRLSAENRKRVNLAVELLSEPSMLFADRPSRGLDAVPRKSLTELFRRLADDKRTVIVATDDTTQLELFDTVCLLHDGHLAYFGPADQLREYFEVEQFTDIYRRLADRTPQTWGAKFDRTLSDH